MSLWVPLPVDVYEHPRMLSAMDDREGGDAALALYCAGLAYAKKHSIIPAGALRLLTRSRRPARVAACLVRHGLWQPTEGGYMPIELTGLAPASCPPGAIEARREPARVGAMTNAERQAAHRARQRATVTPAVTSNDASNEEVTATVTPAVTSNEPLSALSPSEETEQSRAEQIQETRVEGVTRNGRSNDQHVTPPAPPALPTEREMARAYVEGVAAATGSPRSYPTKRWDLDALEVVARTHFTGMTGDALLTSMRTSAQAYVEACRGLTAHSAKGFAVESWCKWLDAGSRSAAAQQPGRRPAMAVQPAPEGGSDWSSKAIRIHVSDDSKEGAQ